jgi:cobalt/nickel transport system permease protein
MLLHIGAFRLDGDSAKKTPWHTLAPHTRILCVLMLVFAIALTPNGHWLTWEIYSLGILSAVWVSQIPFSMLLRRLAVESSFVGVILISTLFRAGGDVVWQWGWLTITTVGLTTLGSVTFKAMLSLLLLNVLTLTTPVPDLLQALAILKMPPLLVAILASMYRYLAVLVEEFSAMRRAAVSRNLMNSKHWQRMVVGNMVGSLFIRTYERGERVHQAMLSRGYQGLPTVHEQAKSKPSDRLAVTLTFMFVVLGQSVYVLRF